MVVMESLKISKSFRKLFKRYLPEIIISVRKEERKVFTAPGNMNAYYFG